MNDSTTFVLSVCGAACVVSAAMTLALSQVPKPIPKSTIEYQNYVPPSKSTVCLYNRADLFGPECPQEGWTWQDQYEWQKCALNRATKRNQSIDALASCVDLNVRRPRQKWIGTRWANES